MIHNIYSVRDNIAEQFMGGFESVNDGTAIRAFKDACNDEKQLGKNAKDYTLFKTSHELLCDVVADAVNVVNHSLMPPRIGFAERLIAFVLFAVLL